MMAGNPALTAYVNSTLTNHGPCKKIVGNANYLLVHSQDWYYSDVWHLALSSDGVNFSDVTISGVTNFRGFAPVCTDTLTMIVPLIGSTPCYKYNGSAWVSVGLPPNGTSGILSGYMTSPFYCSVANNRIFVFCDMQNHQTNAAFYTTDGTNWSEISIPTPPDAIYDPARPYYAMYYKNGVYYLLSKKVSYYTSTDLVNWTQHKFYNPYLFSSVNDMPDILDLLFTDYSGANQIFCVKSGPNSPASAALYKLGAETNGIVALTAQTWAGSAVNGKFATVGGGLLKSGVSYYDGSLMQSSGVGPSSDPFSAVLFGTSLFVCGGTVASALYNTSWLSESTVDLTLIPPSGTSYFLVHLTNTTTATATFQVSGGTPPYTWSIAPSSYGDGLATHSATIVPSSDGLSATATMLFSAEDAFGDGFLEGIVVSGTSIYLKGTQFLGSSQLLPVQKLVGPIQATVTVRDSASPTPDTATLNWIAYPTAVEGGGGAITINTSVLLPATVGVAYSATLGSVTGGTSPYTWSLVSKDWNDAAAVSASGVLTTTFSTAGTYSLQAKVVDSSQPPQEKTAQIAVTAQESPNTATIQGTLRLDTSDGVFAARKVYLYDYTTGAKVAETTSDGSTGAWEFTQVAPGEYFVVGAAQGDDLNVPRDFDALGVITVT